MKNDFKHLAVIPDGNRRWAKANNQSLFSAYLRGIETLKHVLLQCLNHQIQFVSAYGLSAENAKQRSKLMLNNLLTSFFHAEQYQKLLDFLNQNQICCLLVGDLSFFSKKHQASLKMLEQKTFTNQAALTLFIYLNYGGKQEILNAVNHCLADDLLNQNQILTMEMFNHYLNPNDVPSPDVLLRTGGYCRLSNYLLWQMDYTEIYFESCLWPDFTDELFESMYQWFNQQKRNFGQ